MDKIVLEKLVVRVSDDVHNYNMVLGPTKIQLRQVAEIVKKEWRDKEEGK